MTKCRSMLEAFVLGGDFHSRTALNMFDHIQDVRGRKWTPHRLGYSIPSSACLPAVISAAHPAPTCVAISLSPGGFVVCWTHLLAQAISKGDCLLEWDGEGKSPKPLLKDLFASERRKAKVLSLTATTATKCQRSRCACAGGPGGASLL